jgi:hypothetical protein
MLSFKDTVRTCSLFRGKLGIIPSPAAGSVPSVVSGMKPAWGYSGLGDIGVPSCCAVWLPLDRMGGARFAAVIANRGVALPAHSSVLNFVSPKATF